MPHPEPCWKETAPTRADEISISRKAQWQATSVASLGKHGPPLPVARVSLATSSVPKRMGIHVEVTRLFRGPKASLATPHSVSELQIDGIVPNVS